jgi:hypothetical protein
MADVIYRTDSDEHLINTGEKLEPKWYELTEEEIEQDIIDSWDMYDRMNP